MNGKVTITVEISSHTLARALKYVNEEISLDKLLEQSVQALIIRREENENGDNQ
jgi:hypothetical protein